MEEDRRWEGDVLFPTRVTFGDGPCPSPEIFRISSMKWLYLKAFYALLTRRKCVIVN